MARKKSRTTRLTTPKLLFLASPEAVTKAAERELARARRILASILASKGPRTVDNTLVLFNEISRALSEVGLQGQLLFNAHADSALRDAANRAYLAADSFGTELSLNRGLYETFAALNVSRKDDETRYAVAKILRDFRRAGVDKDEATRAKIKELNDEIAEIGSTFDRIINDDRRSITVEDKQDLAGLPQDFVDAHAPKGSGKITLTTDYPDAIPVFQYAANADVRRRLQREFNDRGYPKNLEVLGRLLEKRHELARLLGYEHYAAYVTEDKMIGSSEAASKFVEKILRASEGRTADDYEILVARKRQDAPSATGLDAWDPNYYLERVRAEEYRFDSQEVRPYLEFQKVRDGIFEITSKLFGVRYRRVRVAKAWHPSVEVYDVYEGGTRLGRFYLDLHPREGKFSHAAMFPLLIGLRGAQLPHAALLCNFPDPRKTTGPALMEHTEVVTFFHEFGHLLHTIFSGHTKWMKTSLEGIEWDFVEAPSQMLEEWVRRPEGLQRFAKHHETGEPIPKELVERMERAQAVGRGLWVQRQDFFAALSLAYYGRDPSGLDTTALAKALNATYYPVPWFEGTHFQCSFGHLNGYSAIYYTYLWSLVIAKDLFSRFAKSKSILDPSQAKRYRKEILEAASIRPAAEMVERFLGRETSFDAFRAWLNQGAT